MLLAAGRAASDLRLDVNALDYAILAVYFVVVLAIGLLARRVVATSEDFFLSGRALPAWVTGLAFISANLGAIEILGMAANGAQYGFTTVHFYWVGAIPAMVFLGLVMMPFYYASRVHSVPEYMRRRFNAPTHFVNATSFAVAQLLTAGVNLYALSIVIEALLGWPQWVAIVVAAFFVLTYITLGGLSGAVYNEVMQFFVIIAGLIPIVVIGLSKTGGWTGLQRSVGESEMFSTWVGTDVPGWTNPLGDWIGIVFGLGFALSFGYWTTNFAEVQRALSAKDLSAARRTPLIGAFPKVFIPFLTIIPGLIAIALVPGFGSPDATYNNAIPALMRDLLPNGALGIGVTGLLAVFILALFWKRVSAWVGFYGLLAGIAGAFAAHYVLPTFDYFHVGQVAGGSTNDQMVNFYGAIVAVIASWVVMTGVTAVTRPKPREELAGFVWGEPDPASADLVLAEARRKRRWWESPVVLGVPAGFP